MDLGHDSGLGMPDDADGLGQRPNPIGKVVVTVTDFNQFDKETRYEATAAVDDKPIAIAYGPTPSIAEVRARDAATRIGS